MLVSFLCFSFQDSPFSLHDIALFEQHVIRLGKHLKEIVKVAKTFVHETAAYGEANFQLGLSLPSHFIHTFLVLLSMPWCVRSCLIPFLLLIFALMRFYFHFGSLWPANQLDTDWSDGSEPLGILTFAGISFLQFLSNGESELTLLVLPFD